MKQLLLMLLLVVVFAFPAIAAEESTFRSFTNEISCGQIIENLKNPAGNRDFVLLVGGFVTGTNYAKNRDSSLDMQSMLAITEKSCRENPQWSLTAALILLDKIIETQMTVKTN